MNYDILGLYRENAFIKYNAAAFSKSGREEDKENLLVQLVIRLKLDECGAPTPMTDTGFILRIEPFTDGEGRQWMPLYTDRVFLGKCELDYVLDMVMRIEHGK